MDGAFFEAVKLLQKQLNFTYELFHSDDLTWGIYNESLGGWTSLLGVLERKEIDFAVLDMNILLERTQGSKINGHLNNFFDFNWAKMHRE